MKWFWYLVLTVAVVGAWVLFSKTGDEVKTKKAELAQVYELGDPDGKAAKMEETINGL